MRGRPYAPVLLAAAAVLAVAGFQFRADPAGAARPHPSCWPPGHCRTVTPSPTVTPTSPAPTPTVTTPAPTTPAPSPTVTGAACTVPLGQNCGPYTYPPVPMSNGFDTYVANQDVGALPGTAQTVTAADPGHWSLTASDIPAGYEGVQAFPDIQQLTNDWCGTGWGGCASPSDTPLDALSHLTVSYAETSPAAGIWEFAPDIWSANYPSDVMFWADTLNRCNAGAFGSTLLGSVMLSGQDWTAHRYGGAGAEIIFTLDGPAGPGSCARQPAGIIDIKAGLDWLTANGYVTGPEVLTQLNTGWEICSTAGASLSFTVSSYTISAGP